MTEARTPSQNTAQSALSFRPSLLHFSLMLALGTAVILPAAASDIHADKSAPKNQQATVLNAANGVTQVNIQTPTAGGVSVNQYRRFDVDNRGVILNNSRRNVQTQLGGWIQGNPWLATGEAKVIVNQVNSANPSLLNGYIEVGGRRAEVVLANPAGIQVDGGGFINAKGATLTTGLPFIRNGALDGFQVSGAGKVGIGKGGLDGRDAGYTRILSRAAEINGGIWAKDLQITAGENDFDAQGKHTPRSSANVPAVAIDTAELGGMYADKITLISTDKGATVRNQGQIFAGAGGVSIDASGRLNHSGTTASQGSADIRADRADNTGTVSAKEQLNVRADTLDNSGTVLAGGELNARIGDTLNNRGDIQAARLDVETPKLDNGGVLSQTGLQGLAVESAGSFANSGQIGYPEADAPSAGGGGTSVPPSVSAPKTPGKTAGAGGSATAVSTPATVQTFATGSLKAGRELNNTGRIQANGGIDFHAKNGLKNTAGLRLNKLTVSGGALDNQNGKIAAQSTDIRTQTVQNDKGELTVADLLSIQTARLSNRAGKLQSAGDADLAVTGRLDNQNGEIAANQALNIHDQGAKTLHIDNADGSIVGNDVALQSKYLNNQGKLAAARDLSLDVKDDLTVERDLAAGNALSIRTEGNLNNARSITADDAVKIQVKQNVDNRGLINSNGLTRVKAGGELLNAGTGRIYGNHVALAADSLTNREENGKAAVVAARERLEIGAKDIVNQEGALLSSEGGLGIGGSLNAEHTATGRADSLINSSARIEAQGNGHIAVKDLKNLNKHFKVEEYLASSKQITSYKFSHDPNEYILGKDGTDRITEDNFYFTFTDKNKGILHYYKGGVNNATRYKYTQNFYRERIVASKPAEFIIGGNLNISGNTWQNKDSQFLVGGTIVPAQDGQKLSIENKETFENQRLDKVNAKRITGRYGKGGRPYKRIWGCTR